MKIPLKFDGEIFVAITNLIETVILLSSERCTKMKMNAFSFEIKAAYRT